VIRASARTPERDPRRLPIGRVATSIACALATLFVAFPAAAHPQANAALTLGLAENGDRDDWRGGMHASTGVRGDVLFLRERDLDFGIGPYVEGLTTSFHDVELGGGATALLPVHEYLPIVLSAGPYARHTEAFAWEPGLAASLFWGSRGYNFHSDYGLSGGLLVQARYGLGDSHETSIIVGAQVDLVFIAMPFMFAYDAIRHM
jgi:hypothetical protein